MDKIETRLDQHERLLQRILQVKNTKKSTHAEQNNQRSDKLELAFYKMNSDIDLIFQETQTSKRDIAQLKN